MAGSTREQSAQIVPSHAGSSHTARSQSGSHESDPRERGRGAQRRRSLQRLDPEEFLRRLELDRTPGQPFALFLGAGCSVSSGVPTAGELVTEHWLPRLHRRDSRPSAESYLPPAPHELEKWAAEQIPDYDPQQPAAAYAAVLELLCATREERERELDALSRAALPSLGYAALAELVTAGASRFDLILTTNFDDLVARALYLYTSCTPVVVEPRTAVACLRTQSGRALIVKLGAPRGGESASRSPAQRGSELARLCGSRGLICIGLGGLDATLHALLAELPPSGPPQGCFWVHPDEPHGPIRSALEQCGGSWVRAGFDAVLRRLHGALKLPEPRPRALPEILVGGLAEAARLALAPGTSPALRDAFLLELFVHAAAGPAGAVADLRRALLAASPPRDPLRRAR